MILGLESGLDWGEAASKNTPPSGRPTCLKLASSSGVGSEMYSMLEIVASVGDLESENCHYIQFNSRYKRVTQGSCGNGFFPLYEADRPWLAHSGVVYYVRGALVTFDSLFLPSWLNIGIDVV